MNNKTNTPNSYFSRLNRMRSVASVCTLIPEVSKGVTNDKTIRRRKVAVREKLSALGVTNINDVMRQRAEAIVVKPEAAKAKATAPKKRATSKKASVATPEVALVS